MLVKNCPNLYCFEETGLSLATSWNVLEFIKAADVLLVQFQQNYVMLPRKKKIKENFLFQGRKSATFERKYM